MQINDVFECTQEEFDNLKSRDKVSLKCTQCNNHYSRSKKDILDTYKRYQKLPSFCSLACNGKHKKETTNQLVECLHCGIKFTKLLNQVKKYPNHFCSHVCSATWQNKNKDYGTRRSKLEVYLESQLKILYPDLEIIYSNRQIINSELDIYIPSLNIAFEIQGIFHYEPIFRTRKIRTNSKERLN